jgi:hypothetical protein
MLIREIYTEGHVSVVNSRFTKRDFPSPTFSGAIVKLSIEDPADVVQSSPRHL